MTAVKINPRPKWKVLGKMIDRNHDCLFAEHRLMHKENGKCSVDLPRTGLGVLIT